MCVLRLADPAIVYWGRGGGGGGDKFCGTR